jgi:Mce-associated membrane protein
MITNFYDLLDLAPDATGAQIKAAWKSAIADLDPTDRRFRVYNQAAEVLLDPQRRREYDAQLAASSDADEPGQAGERDAGVGAPPPSGSTAVAPGVVLTQQSWARTAATGRRGVPSWVLAGLAVVTAVAVGASSWLWFAEPSDASVEESTRAAQSAAERAIGPILSYSALHLDEDQKAAQAYLTSDYREEYDKVFAVIKQNAPGTKTIVKADVVGSGIVRSGTDRVQVLVFVNRPTTNKQIREPVVYKDQVTLTMERVDGEWLVDDMTSSPVAR